MFRYWNDVSLWGLGGAMITFTRVRKAQQVDKPVKQESDKQEYTKQEMQLYTNAVAAIASAVLQQWKADGCPEDDYSIKIWKGVLRNAMRGDS